MTALHGPLCGGRRNRGRVGKLRGGRGEAGVPAEGGEASLSTPRCGAPVVPVRPRRPQGGTEYI